MLVEQFCNARCGDRKSRVCPDNPGLGIVTEQNEQRLFVAMRVEVKVSVRREIHHLLDPFRLRRLSVDMEFSDAAVGAARVLVLDQLEDRRIAEPGLYVVAHAIRPDEGFTFSSGQAASASSCVPLFGRLLAIMPMMPLRRNTSRT